MSEETLTENFKRSYEVSIWTLQDSFITVLKPFNLEPKGQIQEAKMTLKDDGTQELSFSIPMYIRDEDGTKHENPIWYNTRNGTIIADLRKIKVIFDKGGRDEAVFEFMIIKVTESHENDELRCEVECEGLAFHELGKIGYKISLSEDDYTEDWMEWADDTSVNRGDEPAATIDYWMYKVLNKNRINWTYSVQMDWGAYDGTIIVGMADDSARIGYAYIEDLYTGKLAHIAPKQYSDLTEEDKEYLNNLRIEKGMRRYDKIYEENYVTSWAVDDNKHMISPVSVEQRREKQRLINIEESNIYNITQTIAETFGVFCKYVYHYDDTYHIIGREIVFYNNFIQESTGHIDFTYPYHTNSISREMDATDTISKMFVKPLANDSANTGYANIIDTAANKSGEDYLLNFSYLHNIGTISEEQFAEIEPYEVKMRKFNDLMIPIEKRITQLNASLPEKEAELQIVKDSQSLAKDRISAADDQLNDILKRTNPNNDEPQSIIVDGSAPVRATPIKDNDGAYSITIRQQGVIPGTVKVYSMYVSNTGALSGQCSFDPDFDEFGNLIKLKSVTNIDFDENNIIKIKYLTYEYVPQLWFENVKKTYTSRLAQDEQKEIELKQEIEDIKEEIRELQAQYNEYKDEKEKAIIDFQNMMGPALREGYWQPEDEYTGYGDKYSENYVLSAASAFDDTKLSSIGWDNEPFEGEQLNYYLEGVNQEPIYYPFIWIDQSGLNELTAEEYDKISFCYLDCATKDSSDNILKYTRYWTIGSQMVPVYLRLKNSNTVAPAFLLTGATSLSNDSWNDLMTIKGEAAGGKHDASVAIVTTNITDPKNPELVIDKQWRNIGARFMTSIEAANYEVVYPRFQVTSLELQDTDDQLSLLQNEDVLENLKDYKVLIRDENYYITLDTYTLLKSGSLFGGTLRFNYTIANTALLIYLDAIQVLKENCMPKVSYQITPSLVSKEFTRIAYKGLDKISHINDYELKFENILGYISEMELDLDRPQEDTYEIKNYKTKFEDLFSTIVAQSEEMKKNSIEIGLAASAFTATGDLKGAKVQSVMDKVDLNYAFNQGALTIDEANGIWATSDSGVVAIRGGGIFTSTEKDQNGDWVWNTGILPSGINASLITTGQLDTNLIRIYAGDTIAFQMNADGLYAYKWDLGSDSYQNQYVVHNKDGLFLHAAKGSTVGNVVMNQDVNRVEISWDGLKLRNNNNETVFYADPDTGNLDITGAIHATSLFIGEDLVNDYLAENVKVGSTNLLLKSNIAITNSSYLMASYTLAPGHNLQAGEDVCVRIWGSLGAGRKNFTVWNTGGNGNTDYLGSPTDNGDGTYTLKCKWRIGTGNTKLLIYVPPRDDSTTVSTITRIKLERGTSFTDWSPAEGELYGASLIVDANQGLIDMRSTSSSSTSAFTMTPNKISVVTSDFRLGADSENDSILSFKGSTNNNFSLRIGPWGVNNTAIYRNNSIFGQSDGLYFGLDGLSISDIFKISYNDTNHYLNYFTITDGEGTDENNYLLNVQRQSDGRYVLSLLASSFSESFINTLGSELDKRNLLGTKIYTATTTAGLKAKTVENGALGIIYTEGSGSDVDVTINSTNITTLASGNPFNDTNAQAYYAGYYNNAWQTQYGGKNTTYFDFTPSYWNIALYSNDRDSVGKVKFKYGLARVGNSTSNSTSWAMYSVVNLSGSTGTIPTGTGITINFRYTPNPTASVYTNKISNSYWTQGKFTIKLYKFNNTNYYQPTNVTLAGAATFTVPNTVVYNKVVSQGASNNTYEASVPMTTTINLSSSDVCAIVFQPADSTLGTEIFIYQCPLASANTNVSYIDNPYTIPSPENGVSITAQAAVTNRSATICVYSGGKWLNMGTSTTAL